MSKKIISTVGASNEYCLFRITQSGVPEKIDSVFVPHGANIFNPITGKMEPYSEVIITDEQAEAIEANTTWQIQKENGYVKIVAVNDKTKAADLNPKDKSAQITESDLKKKQPELKDAKITATKPV